MERDEELERIRRKKLKELTNDASDRKTREKFAKPVEVNDYTLKDTITKNSLVVIDCWAAWCAPCRMIAPIIDELAQDYADKILFGKLNVDENRKTTMQYQIMSIPTLLVFKNGLMVDRIVGVMPREILESKLIPHLQ
ncbi:MAG: thioredoxin [Candidatus Bathyarchaeota archaeon]|nr:MAG: thioredoxin [Candidatus Bathyarchaeota archaeon]